MNYRAVESFIIGLERGQSKRWEVNGPRMAEC